LAAVVFLTAMAHTADVDPLVAKGKILIDQSIFSEAITALNGVLAANSRHVEAMRLRAIAYRNLKQFDAAILDFTRVVELDPKNFNAYAGRAIAKREANNSPAAVEDMNTAVRLAPPKDSSSLLIRLAYFHLDSRNYQGMLDACSRSKQTLLSAENINCTGLAG